VMEEIIAWPKFGTVGGAVIVMLYGLKNIKITRRLTKNRALDQALSK